VLVTGSTAGIGFAIARSLASEGAHVYLNGRTQQRVDAAVAAIRSQAASTKVDGIVADFSSSAGAEAVIAKLPVVGTSRVLVSCDVFVMQLTFPFSFPASVFRLCRLMPRGP
jgi:NAD(P)-dependent dehydrogenase (short-subunit alcohol dehydrogenase family)